MHQKGSVVWYVIVGAVLAGTAYYLGSSNTTDVSVVVPMPPPEVRAYPKLQSDDLPKTPILPPTEPFASGWSEPSPLEAVQHEAERTRRRIGQEQRREMMENTALPVLRPDVD